MREREIPVPIDMWKELAPVTESRLEATRGGDEEVRFIFSLQR